MATIRVKNPNLGGEKWITIPTKILSEADHIVTNKGQGNLYLSNDGTYKDVIKSANDYTDKLIELIIGSSPDILETLKELSNQTSDNKDFINVLNKSIATKLDKTANAVSASKLATPIKLWGNDFDGSLSVYGNLCAPNGNLGLGINANNVVLGNNTNPSYIYGSSVMFKTGTDAVAAYISSDGKIGIGTANPLVGFHVNVNSYFDYPIKVSGTVDHSSPLLKLDATNTNNNGLLVLSKLGNSKAAIGIDDTQGMWFLNLSNSNIFRITSNSLTYGSNKIWHEGNFDPNDYLPLMGGGKIEGDFRSLIIKRNAPYSSSIWYTNTAGQLGGIGVSADKYPIFIDTSDVAHKIWHEGNDGEGSGLDADKLDGLHSGNFAKSLMDVGANNTKSNVLGYTYGTEAHGGASAGGLISAGMGTYGMQLNGAYNGNKLSFRGFSPDGYTDWKTIAFTDYNGFYDLYHNKEIPENANLNDYKNVGTYSTRNNNIALTISNRPFNDAFKLCVEQTIDENTLLQKAVRWFDGQTKVRHMSNNNWGNWYMISTDLSKYNAPTASKLQTPVKLWGNDFDGSNDVNGDISLGGKKIYWHVDPEHYYIGTSYTMSSQSTNLDYEAAAGHRFLSFNKELLRITASGYVGIGTTNPQFKLDVNGDTYSNNIVLGTLGWITSSLTDTFNDSTGRNRPWYGLSFDVEKSSAERTILASYHGMLFKYGGNKISVFDGGNVGIGTYDPQYKLDVNGSIRFSDSLYTERPFSMFTKNDNGEYSSILSVNSTGDLTVGYGTSEVGEFTNIDGNSVHLRYGTAHTKGVILNSSGNVTIGSSDMASVYHKLFVDGSVRTGQMYCTGDVVFGANSDGIYIKNSTILMHDSSNAYTTGAVTFTKLGDALFLHDISVINKIESGDLVDWYGVSWSEDSSDPTCTRIGNMALHRSLPIQSAMKGYVIINKENPVSEGLIIPLNDDWSSLKYTWALNGALSGFNHVTFNVMVKIPEFWYIDDYEPSTKTHNLKISQTAKAGWIHHKEAYVGAYEGSYVDLGYRSKKGEIPLISWSRTDLRNAARVNGYEDEYKWNIYTYEEHRAICHLFLVEYATRNSQLAVNTALTKDGFKQGGLGSGCTTGAVTINGQTTYSFIPTGTTDSLGNGSGQVAYTVTQTDADGNEIGTVTRYANRYRGIENPFGHIWKHVDDIVNVYNAETTYKTVYKCNKPEHFATNKNAKYKPLCSFPGGSKIQGYSKEIKATINCDFFKYSVGGSGSTYWYDYNYDNDDTSEHCLLIGGSSGTGGDAGLFYLHLSYGVGHSGANVGSRLTYLPWAE